MSSNISDGVGYTASAVTVAAGLTFNQWVALAGVLTAVATFLHSVWHKRQMRKLVKEDLELKRHLDHLDR